MNEPEKDAEKRLDPEHLGNRLDRMEEILILRSMMDDEGLTRRGELVRLLVVGIFIGLIVGLILSNKNE